MLKQMFRFSILLISLILLTLGGYWLRWWMDLQSNVFASIAPSSLALVQPSVIIPDSSGASRPASLSSVPEFSWNQFVTPASTFRPYVRWYWPGNRVAPLELIREIGSLSKQGFGGIEIHPTAAGIRPDLPGTVGHRVDEYDSPAFYHHLQLAIRVGRKRGLHMDLALESGGPHIGLDQHLPSLIWGEGYALGGKRIHMPLPPARVPASYFFAAEEERKKGAGNLSDFFPDQTQLVALFAGKARKGARTGSRFDWTDQVELDPDSTFLITEFVQEDGSLLWLAPKGYWKIIAIYAQPSGSRPPHSAQPTAGLVANFLNQSSVQHHLDHAFRPATGLLDLPDSLALSGIFQPSMSWQSERLFSAQFPAAFEAQHGYELLPHLPTVLQAGADHPISQAQHWQRKPEYQLTPVDERIRHDYQETVSQQLLQEFLLTSQEWTQEKSLQNRTQVFGEDIDLIEASGKVDVPEASSLFAGGEELFLKLISSGGEWYQKRQISASWGAHEGASGSSSPLQLRAEANRLFTAGFTHLIADGSPYRWQNPGFREGYWHPFSSPFLHQASHSGNFSEASTYWNELPELNRYLSRCQYILQQGSPVNELWIYYPFTGFPASWKQEISPNSWLLHPIDSGATHQSPSFPFPQEKDPRIAWLHNVQPVLHLLNQQGISWNWINDELLSQATVEAGKWKINGLSGEAVLLLEAPTISYPTALQLNQAAKAGGRILTYGELPQGQAGYRDYEQQEPIIQQICQQLNPNLPFQSPKDLANHLLGFPLPQAIAFTQRYEFLRQISRKDQKGNQWMFVHNLKDKARFFQLSINEEFAAHHWLDPSEGAIFEAKQVTPGIISGYLPAYGSLILYSQKQEPNVPDSLSHFPLSQTIPSAKGGARYELNQWDLLVVDPSLPAGELLLKDSPLFDWRDHPLLQDSEGAGWYQHHFWVGDTLQNTQYLLDFGAIRGAAEIKLNTQSIATLWQSPNLLDVTGKLMPGDNLLEVWLTPPPRNHWLAEAERGNPAFESLRQEPSQRISVGLLGPVVLWELDRE